MKSKIVLSLLLGTQFLTHGFCAPAESTFSFSFKVYGLRKGSYENIAFITGETSSEPVEFRAKSRSKEYEATLPIKNPYLRFIRIDTEPKEGRQLPSQVFATARIHPDWSKVLILFSKDKSDRKLESYKTICIRDDLGTFPRSSVRVLNMTGVNIIGLIGNEKIELKDHECSPAKTISGNTALVSIAVEGTTRYHLLYRNNLRIGKENRALLILRPPTRLGSIRIGGHVLSENFESDNPLP